MVAIDNKIEQAMVSVWEREGSREGSFFVRRLHLAKPHCSSCAGSQDLGRRSLPFRGGRAKPAAVAWPDQGRVGGKHPAAFAAFPYLCEGSAANPREPEMCLVS